MTVPGVSLNELDGNLGVLPSGQKALAIVGTSTTGTTNAVGSYARTTDVVSTFGEGPLVEAACYHIKNTGLPVILVRTGNTVAGAYSAVTHVGAGTSVVTADGTLKPNGDYEAVWKCTSGGPIGTGPISFQWSLDGGRNWSPVTSLGAATSFTFPEGNVKLNFAAGTVLTGQTESVLCSAPRWNSSELTAAIAALAVTEIQWDVAEIVGPIDATAFDALVLAFASLPKKMWIGAPTFPTAGQSDAAYQTALGSAFGSKAFTSAALCAGMCFCPSGKSGRSYVQPISIPVASAVAKVAEHKDIASVNLGALPVSLYSSLGAPVHHDERLNPGLDDLRFVTLRTHETVQGVYVNNPRLFSPSGSDFKYIQHRRVMNLAKSGLEAYFVRRLSEDLIVNKLTGRILESEAAELDKGGTLALEALLGDAPKASEWGCTVSRNDNILSTETLTVNAYIIPLAYPKNIKIDIGFRISVPNVSVG